MDTPVIATDIVPTVLRAAGIAFRDGEFDGVDLAGRLGERTLFWRYGKNVAVRQGKWKLVRQNRADFELFDLSRDVGEIRDLASEEPEVKKRLEVELAKLNGEMVAPRWGGPR